MEHRLGPGELARRRAGPRRRVLGTQRRGGGRVQDVVLLGVVHVVEGLHGTADLLAGHLLEEGEGKAVGPGAVLPRDDIRMELGLPCVHLRPEGQTLWHTQLGVGGGIDQRKKGR